MLIFTPPLEIVLIEKRNIREKGQETQMINALDIRHNIKISAICNFWPQLEILEGQLTPDPVFPSPRVILFPNPLQWRNFGHYDRSFPYLPAFSGSGFLVKQIAVPKVGRTPAAFNFADDRLGHGPAVGSKMAADCLCRIRKLLVILI